jgi:hypothetical protein
MRPSAATKQTCRDVHAGGLARQTAVAPSEFHISQNKPRHCLSKLPRGAWPAFPFQAQSPGAVGSTHISAGFVRRSERRDNLQRECRSPRCYPAAVYPRLTGRSSLEKRFLKHGVSPTESETDERKEFSSVTPQNEAAGRYE